MVGGSGIARLGDRKAVVGATILPDRSACEGEGKWWGPAILDAPAARPSSLKVREPDPPSARSQVFAKTKGEIAFLQDG